MFAAPFRSYGRLLIVDCGGGAHFVLFQPAQIELYLSDIRRGEFAELEINGHKAA